MIGRGVQELEGFTNLVGKLHHAIEKLRTRAATFGPVIHFELELRGGTLFGGWQGTPPRFHRVHDEITGLGRTAKGEAQLPRIFIHQATRNRLCLTAQVVITRLHVTSSESAQ